MLWDTGADFLNRATGVWRDQVAIDLLFSAVKGNVNSLPDSTESTTVTSQFTSADIFHHYGDAVTDKTLPYLFNNNTLKSIVAPNRNLIRGQDYTVTGNNITYHKSLLRTYISTDSTPGSIVNFTLTFSSGAPLTANLVQWDTPTLGFDTIAASSITASDDLVIPIVWKGINRAATLKAVLANGTDLLDSFTEYFGPLQAGRTVSMYVPHLPHPRVHSRSCSLEIWG